MDSNYPFEWKWMVVDKVMMGNPRIVEVIKLKLICNLILQNVLIRLKIVRDNI